MSQTFQKTVLPNGVRVLTESHSRARAISVGIFVNCGTRHESSAQAGICHFIEHLVFKGTEKRSAYEIARALEAVGGDLNAYTSREYTCFVTLTLREHLRLSLDVLSDLVGNACFDRVDFGKEKQVVMQEILLAEEQLEEFVFDRYFELAYPKSAMGHPILGTRATLGRMRRQDVVSFFKKNYVAENLIVAVAGSVQHEEVVALVDELLKPNLRKKGQRALAMKKAPAVRGFFEAVEKPSEQVHVLVGLPASSFRGKLRFEAYILNTLLAGGMTSRLYQAIRERRGLAYSVYGQLATTYDSGLNMVYAATDSKSVSKVVELVIKEIGRISKQGIRAADLELFRTQVTGQILLGTDDIENRMNSLGVNEMIFGRYRSVDEVMKEIQTVTRDSVQEFIEKYFTFERMGVLVMGAVDAESKRNLRGLMP